MVYVCYHYHARCQFKYDTLDEAIAHACSDLHSGLAAYDCVLNDDGSVALDREALSKAVFKYDDAHGDA